MSLEKLHTFDLLIFSDNIHYIFLFIDIKMIRPFNELGSSTCAVHTFLK